MTARAQSASPPPLPVKPPVIAAPPVIQPASPPPQRAAKVERIFSPEELERFKNLLVFARSTVEGYFSGKHKSPLKGQSAEFADYKEYVPGDDIAQLDWRVYGRTRRLYIRQFEEETDMVVYLMVDTSASMRYAGEKRQSKFILAARVAAALAYLMMKQGDKASLTLFADKVTHHVPPGRTRRHLHRMVTDLERIQPASTTGIAQALGETVGVFRKRGRLVVLSDFLTDREALFDALGQFQHRRFEILLLHVFDPDELNLPPVSVAKFVDMETGEQVQVEPDEIRDNYRANMKSHMDAIATEADLRQIKHSLVNTEQPYLEAIEAYLGFRGKNAMFV